MADNALQVQYSQQYIAGYEQMQSLLNSFVTTEGMVKGNQFVFHVADSGSAEAVTRGSNDLIPSRSDNHTQLTAQLKEWHDKPTKSGFNIFSSQGDSLRIMQATSMGVMNRKIDSLILAELGTGTVGASDAAAEASISWVMRGATRLQNAKVPWDNGITFVGSPASIANLLQTTEFTKATYVSGMPLDNGAAMWADKPGYYKWNNINFVSHPGISGIGTASAKCFMFHRSAIGSAVDVAGIQTMIDYNKEHDYSYSHVKWYGAAKLLQNAGVIVMPHNDLPLST